MVTIVGRLQEAARSGNVTAQLALLRALAPEEWGETRKVRVEGGGGPAVGSGPPLIIVVEHSDRDPRELPRSWRRSRRTTSSDGLPSAPLSQRAKGHAAAIRAQKADLVSL